MRDATNINELVAQIDAPWNRTPGNKPETAAAASDFADDFGPGSMEEIDSAVNPRLTKEVKQVVAGVTYISPETFATIGIWSCFTVTVMTQAPELQHQIDELQRGYEGANKAATDHIPRRAAEAYRAYLDACKKTGVETGAVAHCDGKTLQDFEREFKHKFNVAIEAAKTYGPRARELCEPHIRLYVSMVRALADQKAIAERDSYETLALPWQVSKFVATLYRAAEMIEQHGGVGHSPREVAKFMDVANTGWRIERLVFEQPKAGKK